MSAAVLPFPREAVYASLIEPALLTLRPNTARAYATGMRQFLAWLGPRPLTARAAKEFQAALMADHSSATVNLRLAAVRRLAEYAAESGLLDDTEAGKIARVQGLKRRGVRTGNWITPAQAQAILDGIDRSTLIGRRDSAIYALLFGCGLRCEEAAHLDWSQFERRDDRWVLSNVEGKHNRVRTVPVSDWAAELILDWRTASGDAPQGRLLRGVGYSEAVTAETFSEQGVYRRVVAMGAAVGVELASHDFRRSFGRLAAKGGADIEQIQMVYGHADRRTTMGYLNLELDLANAPGDAIRIRVGGKR